MSAQAPITAHQLHHKKDQARETLARLFMESRPRLLALATKMVGADADDVVQDAFVSALRSHHQFRGEALLSTWIYRVTFNAALMRLRSKRRKGAESLDALPVEVAEAVVQAHMPSMPNALQESERKASHEALAEAMRALRPADREIVRLRYVDDLGTDELAATCGLTLSAAKTRLHRARSALREHLALDPRTMVAA